MSPFEALPDKKLLAKRTTMSLLQTSFRILDWLEQDKAWPPTRLVKRDLARRTYQPEEFKTVPVALPQNIIELQVEPPNEGFILPAEAA